MSLGDLDDRLCDVERKLKIIELALGLEAGAALERAMASPIMTAAERVRLDTARGDLQRSAHAFSSIASQGKAADAAELAECTERLERAARRYARAAP